MNKYFRTVSDEILGFKSAKKPLNLMYGSYHITEKTEAET
jgi:hypothetical protein